MLPKHEQHWRRKAEEKARYKNKHLERWLGWWRTPSDRFAGLIGFFTALLFFATLGLWIATKDLVEDARSSGRAWLGPITASIDPPQIAAPLKGIVHYNNTGRQPAHMNWILVPKIFTLKEWNDGTATKQLQAAQAICMHARKLDGPISLAFPTSGFSMYQISYDAGRPDSAAETTFFGDQDIVAGNKIVAFVGCFIYETIEKVRHTSFCFYYRAKAVVETNLAYCTAGQDAD